VKGGDLVKKIKLATALLVAVIAVTSITIPAKCAEINNNTDQIDTENDSSIKTYTKDEKYQYGTLSLTVKYKMVNNTPEIVDASYSCTDSYMSFRKCEFDKTFAKVAYMDNTAKNLHGFRVSVTIYADEIPV
jgi:hypothetical protein